MSATADLHRITDSIELPAPTAPLAGRARRDDRYSIAVTRSPEATAEAVLDAVQGAERLAVIADARALELHGEPLLTALRTADLELQLHTVPPGEPSKSLPRAVELWDALARSPVGRRDVVLNLGGGVVCDLGGWVASAFMRGLPYVNVPTTLMAQVDGALGGKVAVNHRVAKNLLGAFHQPRAVIADVSSLRTLPRRHVAAGLAECVKKAVIASTPLWAFLHREAEALLAGTPEALQALVRAAVAIKTELIARDPYELDLRRPLNFGHTIGHPLETVAGYGTVLHGEAVAFGMVVETRIAAGRGLCGPAFVDDLIGLLRRCELPVSGAGLPSPVDARALVAATEKVRHIRAGSLRFVLPASVGETVIADDVTELEIVRALAECGVG